MHKREDLACLITLIVILVIEPELQSTWQALPNVLVALLQGLHVVEYLLNHTLLLVLLVQLLLWLGDSAGRRFKMVQVLSILEERLFPLASRAIDNAILTSAEVLDKVFELIQYCRISRIDLNLELN